MFRQLVEVSIDRLPAPNTVMLKRCRADADSLGKGFRSSPARPVVGDAPQYALRALGAAADASRVFAPMSQHPNLYKTIGSDRPIAKREIICRSNPGA